MSKERFVDEQEAPGLANELTLERAATLIETQNTEEVTREDIFYTIAAIVESQRGQPGFEEENGETRAKVGDNSQMSVMSVWFDTRSNLFVKAGYSIDPYANKPDDYIFDVTYDHATSAYYSFALDRKTGLVTRAQVQTSEYGDSPPDDLGENRNYGILNTLVSTFNETPSAE